MRSVHSPLKGGAGDGKAIKTGEDLIRDGEIMTIFIEGGRSKTGELMRPRSGCALVAQQMQVPVVPACITIVGNKSIHLQRELSTSANLSHPKSSDLLRTAEDGSLKVQQP